MKHICKIAALVLALALLVTGCSPRVSEYGTTWAATYGTETTYMDEANFWLRLFQWETEGNYAYYYYLLYGVTDMWSMESGNRTQTMEQSLKEDVMAQILQSYILTDHAAEFGVTLTDEDKKKADDFVATLHDSFADEFFELAGGLTDTRMAEIINKRSLAVKVWDAAKKTAEVDLSDKDYSSFTLKYYTVKKMSEEALAQATYDMPANETLVEEIMDMLDMEIAFEDVQESYGEDELPLATKSYLRSNTENVSALYQNGKDMKTGEYKATDYIENDKCWYVIYCESDDDADAAQDAMDADIAVAQDEFFAGLYKEWTAAAKTFTVNKAFGRLKLELSFVSKPTEAESTAEATEADK